MSRAVVFQLSCSHIHINANVQDKNLTNLFACPQGAERKMRDEERKRSKRKGKNDANGVCCKQIKCLILCLYFLVYSSLQKLYPHIVDLNVFVSS